MGDGVFVDAGGRYYKSEKGTKVYLKPGESRPVPAVVSQQAEDDEPETRARKDLMMAPIVVGGLRPAIGGGDLRAVEKEWLGGEAFDLRRLSTEITTYNEVATRAILEVGNRLVAAKMALEHGAFNTWLAQSEFGFDLSMAQKYMAIARAVKQRPELARLTRGGATKAYTIMSLPDAQLDELAEKGTLGGEPVPDLATMTRRDLLARIATLKNKLTQSQDDRQKLIDERSSHVETLELLKARLYDADKMIKRDRDDLHPDPREERVLQSMSDKQLILEQVLAELEAADLTAMSPTTCAKVQAMGEWVVYRAERARLNLQERAADGGFGRAPVGMEWKNNDDRKTSFAGLWPETPEVRR